MDITSKLYEKKDSYSDIESSHNTKLNDGDSLSNANLEIDEFEAENEKICCIEMINNNKIYIKFKENWTVKDLIKSIFKTKEFKKIYSRKDFELSDTESILALFDLHLIIFRSIKDELETKIDFDMSLNDLLEKGLIKNHRYPFFYFKDNRNNNLNIFADEKLLKELNENEEALLCYKKYLPRNNTVDFIMKNPFAQELFFQNKKANNNINNLDFSPLVSEKENSDWFIYDDESLNFLMEMEKTNFELDQLIKFDKTNENKVYFQDNYKNITLLKREYSHILIEITYEKNSYKMECSITHTPAEVLKKLKEKLERINKNLIFDPREKILKVRNLNDYILDINEPFGKLAYINECAKNDTVPKYEIVDNPFMKSKYQEKENVFERSKLDMINYTEDKDSILINDLSILGEKKNTLRKTHMLFSRNLNITSDNSRLTDTKLLNEHNNIDKLGKIAKYNPSAKADNDNPNVQNRISINNFDANKNLKILKSKSKIEENKYNDLYLKIYTSYKNVIQKKINETSTKSEEIKDEETEDEDLDKKISGRVRSRGIGFKIKSNNKPEINETGKAKRQSHHLDMLHIPNCSSILDSFNMSANESSLFIKKQKSMDTMILNSDKSTIFRHIKNYEIEESFVIKEDYLETHNDFEITESPNNNTNINFQGNDISFTKQASKTINLSVAESRENYKENLNNTNNYYKEKEKENKTSQELLKNLTSDINIKILRRPFSIFLHDLNFKKNFNCHNNEKLKDCFYKLNIKIQIYCGSQEYTKPRTLEWKSTYFHKNRHIGKTIEFDLGYDTLPMFASIVFKIKLILFNKQKQPVRIDNLYWTNFKLFDHNRRLKTGLHKINLWDKKFSDDSYYSWAENPDNLHSAKLVFELESFTSPLIHRPSASKNSFNNGGEAGPATTNSSFANNSFFMLNETDNQKIMDIMDKSPFESLNHYDKETLWKNSHSVAQFPSIISRLFECIDYKDKQHLEELDKILSVAKPLNPVQALNLLSGNYLHENIRGFAVDCLKNCSFMEVQEFLIQLIQALKYEMYHDSPLARYLMELAIKYPLTIGHTLFWGLRAEMYNPNVQQRFGLYLEIFLSKIGKDLRKIFEDEIFLIKALLKAADIPHEKGKKNEQAKLAKFREELSKINAEIEAKNLEISLPLNFKMRVKNFVVEKCKTMKSKKKPLWLVFKNADENGEDVVVMFKKGDDLRQDILTLQLFRTMHNLWFENKIKVKMSLYNVICTGYYQGMLEIVKDSVTLAQVHKLYGGAFASLTQKPLKNWMESNCTNTQEEYRNNFLESCVAYCMATWVLGVGDRHNDNIMVKKNGELFHIDFGHFLGHFKKKYGIKRETAPFVFTKEFRNVLGTELFKTFKENSFQSYQVLRKNVDTFVILLRIMLCTGIPELKERFIRFLETSLALKMKDNEAKKYMEEKLEQSLGSIATRINFAIHVLANK